MLNSGPHFKFKMCLSKKMPFSTCQANVGYKMGNLINCLLLVIS